MPEDWIRCPVCGGKTRLRVTENTIIRQLPLFCPKCHSSRVVNIKNMQIEP